MTEKTIILHGSFGSCEGNWFPWLKKELEEKGKQVIVPQMPVGVGNQNYENWAHVLDSLEIDSYTTIIAHSIAPVFVCKYLIQKQISVQKLIFVCGFNQYLGIDPDYDTVNEPMYTDHLEDIKKYCSLIICFYSDNDPYVPYEVEKEFADTVSHEQHVIAGGGHLNAESGYTEFSKLLTVL